MSTKNQDPKQNQTNNEESLQDDLTANKLDVKIKELEKQKLQLEIDTIRGVSKRKKWIFFSLKAAISALVAVPLFWFYYKDVYLPLSQIEHNKLLKETSKMQSEFAQLSKETNIKQHQLDSTKTAMKSKQDSLVALQALLSNTAITLDNTESKLSVLNDSLESATERLVNQEKIIWKESKNSKIDLLLSAGSWTTQKNNAMSFRKTLLSWKVKSIVSAH